MSLSETKETHLMEKKISKFKVGDRVKILDDSIGYVNVHTGDCGEVVRVLLSDDDYLIGDVCVQWDGNNEGNGRWWAALGSLVLEREAILKVIRLTQEQVDNGRACETSEELVDWLKSIGFDVQVSE